MNPYPHEKLFPEDSLDGRDTWQVPFCFGLGVLLRGKEPPFDSRQETGLSFFLLKKMIFEVSLPHQIPAAMQGKVCLDLW